jgi:argininosuccinate synthase
VVVKDLRKEFAEKYCFPMLRARAIYEQDYLLGTSIARPLIAKAQVDGGPPDQGRRRRPRRHRQGQRPGPLRADRTWPSNPKLKIVSPWKDPQFIADGLTDRETAIDFAKKHRIPIDQSKKKIYSRDRNMWHISHEGRGD